MGSYLDLIPISAKMHRRHNRMTILCIVLSVFLVTAVFSMADMGMRMEQARLTDKHGTFSLEDVMNSAMGQTLFLTAAVLFVFVLAAGVLMISGSISSSIARRTKFFGMMRCIGMSQKQIKRLVRLEALNWCKTAVPSGIMLGTAAAWGLCAFLRFFVKEEFASIPLFGVSPIGIVSGAAVGICTVLLAAGSPARRASKVSAVAAVSGNDKSEPPFLRPFLLRFLKADTALGIHHAAAAGKNLVLMTGSFALSILLFFTFSVLIDFAGYLMPQSSQTSDIDITAQEADRIDKELVEKIARLDGVKQVYGRRSDLDVLAERNGTKENIDMISFDEFELDCLKKDRLLKKGSDLSEVYGSSNYALAVWDRDSPWKTGDTIEVYGQRLKIAGLLKYDPFSSDGLTGGKLSLIVSGDTFMRLTKTTDYSLVMVQLERNAGDQTVRNVQKTAGPAYVCTDRREQSTAGTWFAFVSCVYGFLGIILLVTLLHIVNSISMSVSARQKQYGAMRAVGMDKGQMVRMIAAESFTYAVSGCIAGCAAGLFLGRGLYAVLIESHFKYAAWSFPAGEMAFIILFVTAAAAAASWNASGQIRKMSVTKTLNDV